MLRTKKQINLEHFIVSARKYRPQNFEDVVGQEAITNTLLNAINNDHLAQALLFTGPRGVGKTSCARILAKKINQEDQADGTESDFAFNIFELDAASNNSVDDIRSLTDQVRIPPQTGSYKVYIIDEVHMLSQAAFNAFLKTLEEPPAHAIFILATTEKHKIIPTILSRCQIFDFNRIRVIDIKNYLKRICEKENITAEDDALHVIAQKADGAMRDALSIFDRVVSFSGNEVTLEAVTKNLNVLDYDTYFKMSELLLENKIPEILNLFDSILGKGFEGHHFINGLASHFRDLLVAKDQKTVELLEVGDSAKKKYLQQATKAGIPFLMQAIEVANSCDLNYKSSKNQRLLVELALMQIGSITFDGEKKKSKSYIIPATFFQTTYVPKKKKEQPVVEAPKPSVQPQPAPTAVVDKPKKAPVLKTVSRRKNSLTLKSVLEKKKDDSKKTEEINYDNYPKDVFAEKKMQTLWIEYYQQLQKKGEKSMASILEMQLPKLGENFTLHLSLPGKLMKEQLEKEQPKLLGFLKKELNNYGIKLDIKVDKTIKQKIAYTNREKFDELKSKNPLLEKLRQTFELDL